MEDACKMKSPRGLWPNRAGRTRPKAAAGALPGAFLERVSTSVALLLGGLWTIFMSVATSLGFLVSQRWGQRLHRYWGQGCCALLGIAITVEGAERVPPATGAGSGAIFTPNHVSFFDIIVLASLPFDFKWVSKQEVARIPFIGQVMRAMGCYFVTRSHRDLQTLKILEDGLRRGARILMFPEGTRTRTGELLPFKKGPFRCAQNAQVPLIPIALSGTRGIAAPGTFPHRRGHAVRVRFGHPIVLPASSASAEVSTGMEMLRKEILALLAT